MQPGGRGAAGEEQADEICVMGCQTLPKKDLKDNRIGTCEGRCLCTGTVTSQAVAYLTVGLAAIFTSRRV